MPSNKNLEAVKNLTEKLDKANAIYFTDYLGLDVVSITKLRKEFYSNSVEYLVVKNTLLKIASDERCVDVLMRLMKEACFMNLGITENY